MDPEERPTTGGSDAPLQLCFKGKSGQYGSRWTDGNGARVEWDFRSETGCVGSGWRFDVRAEEIWVRIGAETPVRYWVSKRRADNVVEGQWKTEL